MKSVISSQGQPGLFARLPSHRGTIAAMKWNRAVLADGSVFDSPEWRALEIENIVQDPVSRILIPLFQLSWTMLEEGEKITDITDITTPLYQRFQAILTENKELAEKMSWFAHRAYASIDLAHSVPVDEKARIKSDYLTPFLTKQNADALMLTCARVLVKKEFALWKPENWEGDDLLMRNAGHLATMIHRFADMEVWHRGHLNSRSIRKRSDSAVLFFASWLWRNSYDYQLAKGEVANFPVIFACLAEAYRQVQKVAISNDGVFDSGKYTLIPGAGSFSDKRTINDAHLAHAYRDQFPNHWNDHLAYLAGENRKKAATLLDKAA